MNKVLTFLAHFGLWVP